ncbi:hypothetical protein NDU88_007395 [Pleurodeles waltl]|uniref:Uncharacterized protein n=1 Tax=Pleurodeles waltl TaxID=8319 RepID=A0AAV7UNP7_PLEWA|nr:hypothetical protein NDU88_007395 [Pleurodeles waltl]
MGCPSVGHEEDVTSSLSLAFLASTPVEPSPPIKKNQTATDYTMLLDRCSIFSRSPSESGRLYYVRMRRTVRMRTGDLVNFAILNCSPQRALRKRMRALNFYRG